MSNAVLDERIASEWPRQASAIKPIDLLRIADKATNKASVGPRPLRGGDQEAQPSVVTGPNTFNNIDGLFSSYAPMAYMLPFEMLDFIELLAVYNPDYSQAVENMRTLANPGHVLQIDATKGVAKATAQRIKDKNKQIQHKNGGIDGLIDKLLWQAAVYGAMAGEWVPNENMTDIVDFIDVNPKTVKFFWELDPTEDPFQLGPHWAPYQYATIRQVLEAEQNGQKVRNGAYVKLNEITFQYFSFSAAPGSPYGVPPFLAALNNIAIQRDMMSNMASVVKKIALLGLIDIKVESLTAMPGESQSDYQSRATQYLEGYADLAVNMLDSGGIIHFDDATVSSTSLAGNASGATNIFTQNEEQVFSGLKSMPSVQGRSYSTTETYAGVAYDIMIRQSLRYQRAAKLMVEYGYNLMIMMWGVKVNDIKVQFHENKSLQRLQIAQAEHTEIINELMKWAAGITNQVDAAHALGHPDADTPLTEVPNSPWFSAGSSTPVAQPFSISPDPDDESNKDDGKKDDEGNNSKDGKDDGEPGGKEEDEEETEDKPKS